MPFQNETLQEHTKHLFVFCRLVCIPKPNQSIFLYKFAQSRQKRHNLEIFAISTTLRSFEEFFQETADVFLKILTGLKASLS